MTTKKPRVVVKTSEHKKKIMLEKSLFEVREMDCPAEESLVRMALDGIEFVESLQFDIPARKVAVYHSGGLEAIETAIDNLNLGSRLLKTETASDTSPAEMDNSQTERKVLWAVLIINFSFFVIEALFGLLSGSMGLVADSLDMLADAIVYGLSIAAVGAVLARKKSLATISGYFQLTLAVIGLIEVLRRFLGHEQLPNFQTMIIVSALALIANGASLYLLQRTKSQEVHMQASMIFTSNDVIINIGVIAAGILVHWLNSGIPDLVIGAIIFIIVTRGAFRILQLGKASPK